MSEHEAASVGETGGLPGANAAPETAELPEDEAVTVGAGNAIPPQEDEHDYPVRVVEDAVVVEAVAEDGP